MAIRFQKRVRIAPGVRVNLTASKKGFTTGLTAGPKGATITVNSKGRKTTTLSAPGTGISHVKSSRVTKGEGRFFKGVGVAFLGLFVLIGVIMLAMAFA